MALVKAQILVEQTGARISVLFNPEEYTINKDGTFHVTEQYENNPIEADHGRLKARLRPMRGLKRLRSTAVIAAGHAFIQNLRRGFYELAIDVPAQLRLASAFDELAQAV